MAKIMKAAEMEKCIGCYCCMLACARQVHSSLSLDRSGIHIRTLGGLTAGFQAVVCLACLPAPCAEACPTGAFRQRKGGGVRYSREACIHCGSCKEACPVDAIIMDRETGEPVVCYHCGSCVPFCPHSCLIMTEGKKPKGDVI